MPPTSQAANKSSRFYTVIPIGVKIGKQLTAYGTEVLWLYNSAEDDYSTPYPFKLLEAVVVGRKLIPKKVTVADDTQYVEDKRFRYSVDKTLLGRGLYVTSDEFKLLFSELLSNKVTTRNGTNLVAYPKATYQGKQYSGFFWYILTCAGVKVPKEILLRSKSVLSAVRGADEADRLRVIGAGYEAILSALISWEPTEGKGIADFMARCVLMIGDYTRHEGENIRGEKYGLLEEAELSLNRSMGGNRRRIKAVSKAVGCLRDEGKAPTIENVTLKLEDMGTSKSLFGNGKVYYTTVSKALLGPVRAVSYDYLTDEQQDNMPIDRNYLVWSKRLAEIEHRDVAGFMGRPTDTTFDCVEGYEVLNILRSQLMEAFGRGTGHGNCCAFKPEEARALDALLFSDLNFSSVTYRDKTAWFQIAHLREKIRTSKTDDEKEIYFKELDAVKNQAYIEVPDIVPGCSRPKFGAARSYKGFRPTWINNAAVRLAQDTAANDGVPVAGKLIAQERAYLEGFVEHKLRGRGYLTPDGKYALPVIKELAFLFDEINYQPAIDLRNNSPWRRLQQERHWAIRNVTVRPVLRNVTFLASQYWKPTKSLPIPSIPFSVFD